jgi:flagellar assembly factor FliW
METPLDTARFGTISVRDDAIINLPEGIPGFSFFNRAVLVPAAGTEGFEDATAEEVEAFWWLQSVDDGELAFLCVVPWAIEPEYEIEFDERAVEATSFEHISVLAIMTITEDAITANLRAPLVMNTERRVARQIVLADDRWPIRAKVGE